MAGKILFPVDFSPMSETMLGCVEEMSRTGLDDIILAHVVEGSPFPGSVPRAREEEGREKLEELAGKAAARGLKVRTRLLTGHPARAIVSAATEEDVDLIYIGSHGWGYFHRYILGSQSDGTVKLADRPVLVYKCRVKENESGYGCEQVCSGLLGNILVANDFSDYADRVRPALVRFAADFCTRVTLLHVQETLDIYGGEAATSALEEEARKNMDRLVELSGEMTTVCEQVETHVITGEPVPRILQVAGEIGATMIVIGALGRHAGHGEMIGGAAERILRRSEVPVMVMKTPPEKKKG